MVVLKSLTFNLSFDQIILEEQRIVSHYVEQPTNKGNHENELCSAIFFPEK